MSYELTQKLINKCFPYSNINGNIINDSAYNNSYKYKNNLQNITSLYNGTNIDCIEFQALYKTVLKNKFNIL